MSNFDEKFGPRPVHVMDELRVLAVQFLVVMMISYAIEPSFLHTPRTSSTSVALATLFSLLTVVATIAVHRSFIVPQ